MLKKILSENFPQTSGKLLLKPATETESVWEGFSPLRQEESLNRGVSYGQLRFNTMLTTKQDETPIAYQLIAQTQDWKGKAKYWRKEYFKLRNGNGHARK